MMKLIMTKASPDKLENKFDEGIQIVIVGFVTVPYVPLIAMPALKGYVQRMYLIRDRTDKYTGICRVLGLQSAELSFSD